MSNLYIKTISLPRQARDKHRENSKKKAFLAGARAAALPAGWDEISYVAYFGGARYAVTARHGQHANITLMGEDEFSSLNIV